MSGKWNPQQVQPGDTLIATDAGGEEHECFAASAMFTTEGIKRGTFWPAIKVRFTTTGDPVSWPVDALRPPGAKDDPAAPQGAKPSRN